MKFRSQISFGRHQIGDGCPPFVIAEISANHGHKLEKALEIVRQAAKAGADAVKMQTYTADTLTLKSDGKDFRVGSGTLWEGRTLYDLYEEAYTPWEWHAPIKELTESLGMEFFSTPFDATAVDYLRNLKVEAYKIASFEIVDVGLIRRVAEIGKPVILSTGMASLEEIREAVETVAHTGNDQLVLLKCTSGYPAKDEEMNLLTIPALKEAFNLPVGLSDHTLGVAVPAAAVALGACVVEKHITLSRADGGPDGAFSLEPDEFADMVKAVRTASVAMGGISYTPGASEAASRAFRRSLYAVEDIRAGEKFSGKNIRSIRPGHGLHPRHLPQLLGAAAAADIPRGTALRWEHLRKNDSSDKE